MTNAPYPLRVEHVRARRDEERAKRATTRVGVVVVEGCLAVAVSALVEAFAIADMWRARRESSTVSFDVKVLAATPSVRSFTGREVTCDLALDAFEGDLVVCAPVATHPVAAVEQSADIVSWLETRASAPDVTLASVCTGAFFLAEAGVLDGRRATTNPLFRRAFAQRYPHVELALSRVIVDEGDVITAGTATAAVNLALHLIERHAGIEIASLTAKSLAVDKNRDTQAPYLIPTMRIADGDDLVVRTQRFLEARHPDADVSLEVVAAALGASARSLQRRFADATGETPMTYLRLVRLESAKRLLETTRDSIDEIVAKIGYRDARSFARLFRTHTDLTPTAYRARFGLR